MYAMLVKEKLLAMTMLPFSTITSPQQLQPDPDPAFYAGYQSGSRVLMIKNLTIYSWIFLMSKIAIYVSLDIHKGHPSYTRSLQPSKENMQHFHLIFLWVIFALVDPDPFRIRIRNTGYNKVGNWHSQQC
jgi:hypothetical protein